MSLIASRLPCHASIDAQRRKQTPVRCQKVQSLPEAEANCERYGFWGIGALVIALGASRITHWCYVGEPDSLSHDDMQFPTSRCFDQRKVKCFPVAKQPCAAAAAISASVMETEHSISPTRAIWTAHDKGGPAFAAGLRCK